MKRYINRLYGGRMEVSPAVCAQWILDRLDNRFSFTQSDVLVALDEYIQQELQALSGLMLADYRWLRSRIRYHIGKAYVYDSRHDDWYKK